MDESVVLYGAGGHAKVVLDALELAGQPVVGVIDDDARRQGTEWCGYPVSPLSALDEFGLETKVIIAIGDASDRRRLTARILEAGYQLGTAIHPSADIARDVVIGPGVMVLAQAAINPGCRVGDGAIINTGATVDHDCTIGQFALVAPGVHIAGAVEVGPGALIGIGACIIPGVKIGARATVGAGAVVIEDVDAGDTVVGSPARSVARSSV